MLTQNIQPGFYETDALGHINNTVVPRWFESARLPIFKLFTPDLDPHKWQLIVVKIELEYLAQIAYQHCVELQTQVTKVGNSSFQVSQAVLQGKCAAKGLTTMVQFNYQTQQSIPISDDLRSALLAL